MPALPAKDVKELVALAKSKPGKLNFAVSGIGGANHLAGVDFALRSGIKWAYIPYKGGSQALTDLAGGQADVMFNGMVATYPMVKGGKLKALAISSAKRFSAAPDIPTVAESGLPGFETGSFQGIVAPAGTPPEIVDKLHADDHQGPGHAGNAGASRERGRGTAARYAGGVRHLHPRRKGALGKGREGVGREVRVAVASRGRRDTSGRRLAVSRRPALSGSM